MTTATKDGYERNEEGHIIITADGVQYVVKPLDINKDFKIVEDEIIKRRAAEDTTAEVAAELEKLKSHPSLQKEMMDRFYRDIRGGKARKPTRDEMYQWLDTREGLIFTLRLQLSKDRDKLTDDQVSDILNKAGLGESKKMMDLRDNSNEKLVVLANHAKSLGIDTDSIAQQREE